MFRVALYEVPNVSNFGSPALYFDINQHRDTILEGVAASSVKSPCSLSACCIGNRTAQCILPPCGSLDVKVSRPWEFCMIWLTSVFGSSYGLMGRDLDLLGALRCFVWPYMKSILGRVELWKSAVVL